MVRRARSINGFSTNLTSSVVPGATSWTLDSVTGLGTEGDFYLTAGSEIVKVTHIDVGTKTVTVIPAQAGTVQASHGAGVTVATVDTADGYYERMNELGARNVLPFGRVMTGTGTILTASNFTLRNTGTGVGVSDGADGIIRFTSKTHGSNDVSGATRDFSNVNDWRITAHISSPAVAGAGIVAPTPEYFGLTARQSTGGQVKGIWLRPGNAAATGPNWGKVRVDERTSFLAGFTALATTDICGRRDMWFRLEIEWDVVATTDHFRWYCSFDGVHFVLLHTHMFAAGQHQVGIWANNDNGPDFKRYFINSWLEEALTF